MAITAAMVKELRDSTGAGMMDAKKALTESNGDMETAVDWLRTKGLAKAAKKSGRTAAEGLVALAVESGKGVAVEVNSETDFVAKNADFQSMVGKIANAALGVGDVAALNAADIDGKPVSDVVTDAIATIGENMTLRRAAILSVGEGVVATYVHNAVAPGAGKIGVAVALESAGDSEVLNSIGRQVAMHVAATNPLAGTRDEVPAEIADRERALFADPTQGGLHLGRAQRGLHRFGEGNHDLVADGFQGLAREPGSGAPEEGDAGREVGTGDGVAVLLVQARAAGNIGKEHGELVE